jgi:hypothetical protein
MAPPGPVSCPRPPLGDGSESESCGPGTDQFRSAAAAVVAAADVPGRRGCAASKFQVARHLHPDGEARCWAWALVAMWAALVSCTPVVAAPIILSRTPLSPATFTAVGVGLVNADSKQDVVCGMANGTVFVYLAASSGLGLTFNSQASLGQGITCLCVPYAQCVGTTCMPCVHHLHAVCLPCVCPVWTTRMCTI